MRAEQAVTKVSRDYIRFARKMAEIKNSMDRAQELLLAREEAEAECLQKGMEAGRAEGLQKGRVETARNALAKGLPIDTISQITGLSEQEIAGL